MTTFAVVLNNTPVTELYHRIRILLFLALLCVVRAVANTCSNAYYVEPASECSFTRYQLTAGMGAVGDHECGWVSYGFPEVWIKSKVPDTKRMAIATEGQYLDGYLAIYTGSCGNLHTYRCTSNGRVPEVVDINDLPAGADVWFRIASGTESRIGVCIYKLNYVKKPNCSLSTEASDHCSNATLIQTPNGYCGNTSDKYSAEKPGNLESVFCGSIENNSWLKFVASEEKATLNVFVTNCKYGIGVQMRVYATDDCNKFIPYSNCWNPAFETNGVVTAENLTPGKSYLLMIDGYAGDVCDYTISAGDGVEMPQTYIEDVICKGKSYDKYGFHESKEGVYKRKLTGPSGKDSLVVLSLSVEEPSSTELYGQIYSCEWYDKYGFHVNTPGKHTRVLKSAVGCDSTVTLNLKVDNYKEYDLNAVICSGERYALNGFNESKSGDYIQRLKTKQGCDSIVTLHLEVRDGLDLHVDGKRTICAGESTEITASGGNSYIWTDSRGNEIGRGEKIKLSPSVDTKYYLTSTMEYEDVCPATVTDCQGNEYKVLDMNGVCWMAENLKCTKYDTKSERKGYTLSTTHTDENYGPYYFNPSTSTSKYSGNLTKQDRSHFGYLYSWAAAVGLGTSSEAITRKSPFGVNRQGICPNGWHIPTESEVNALVSYVGGTSVAGRKLKSKDGWYKGDSFYKPGNDTYGFAIYPTGLAVSSFGDLAGGNGGFWTSTPDPSNGYVAYDFYTFYTTDEFKRDNQAKYYARAVRCVRD